MPEELSLSEQLEKLKKDINTVLSSGLARGTVIGRIENFEKDVKESIRLIMLDVNKISNCQLNHSVIRRILRRRTGGDWI